MRRWVLPALICILAGTGCGSSAPVTPAGPTLRIGVDLPLTGHEARAAVPALNGIRYFVQTHHELDGFTVALTTQDDAQGATPNPDLGAANVKTLIADPTVVAMIGPFDAVVARKEIPIANEAGLAMVSPATSNPCLTRDVFIPAALNPARVEIKCTDAGIPGATELRPRHTNNFFRLTTTDELQGAAAAEYAFTKLHLLRAAVLSDHESYGQGLADAFSARFTTLGGTIVGHLDFKPDKPDASAFLATMKEAGAQAIYYGGGSHGGCGVRAQMKTVFPPGEATPFLGGDGIAQDPACTKAAADNSAGIFATVPFADASARPGGSATIRSFKSAYGNATAYGPYTLVAYDATAVLYAALDRAIKSAGGRLPPRPDVVSELARTEGLAGATGDIGFDRSGDTTSRMVTIFEATGADPRIAWRLAFVVDYSAHLPY